MDENNSGLTDGNGQAALLGEQTAVGSHDALYATLAEQKRRHALRWMANTHTAATWDDASFDRNGLVKEFEQTLGMNHGQATATLHHSVLPRLVDLGIIAYDSVNGTIHVRSPDAMETVIDILTAVDTTMTGD
jgi:hypothetical protein